ncbi:hypothetical protein [Solirubrobacter soli]|uniref:hypothetical protein n=1 Tax=Solirubrobacter soli TaxID=363832 RepID=UPI00041237F4|nr:hypothetical protein [Solirubrobacter soli]
MPLRVAFVGPAATFGAHALHAPADGVEPVFVDARDGASVDADVTIALDPARVPDTGGATLAIVGPRDPAPEGFDRVLRTPGPHLAAGAWRSRPLPVDDRLYHDPSPSARPPKALFLAKATPRREWIVTPAKHDHDVVHYTHGLTGDALSAALEHADVGIALHAEGEQGFPSQTLLHLAAGQLLLSERLSPNCGLEPGIDFLEIDSRDHLLTYLIQLRWRPDAYERVRVRGRLKAEEHRASRVWPRIARDLLQDLRVFGR